MSSNVPEASSAAASFRELELLVRHLGEDLAAFRRRALTAEARVKALEEAAARRAAAREAQADEPHPRVDELERENAELRRRLESATARTRHVLERVRFLRQQHAQGGER
ncbi:MAG: hypothetical protein ACJ79S_09170 [Gemmatimonadaceae bacterium]